MVPVAANHTSNVIDRQLLPRFIANMLPSRYLFQHQQSHFVTCVKEVPRLRIVRRAHDVAMKLITQYVGIATLYAPRHRLADPRVCLMPIQTA